VCESVRKGRSVRQRTIAELGRLDEATASDVAAVCETPDSECLLRYAIGLPVLLNALLRVTSIDALLRQLGRRPRGRSLEGAVRLLIAGRLGGVDSTAEIARRQDRLLGHRGTQAPASYDLLLRTLTGLGEAAQEVERYLGGITEGKTCLRLYLDSAFGSRAEAPGPALHVEATAESLFPLCVRAADTVSRDADICACSDGAAPQYTASPGSCRLVDLGNTRTLLGRTLLRSARESEAIEFRCGARARLVTGPDGRLYVLFRPGDTDDEARERLLERVNEAERGLAQLERDVRAGKVRRRETIEARARSVVDDARAWRWLEFEAGEGQFASHRRSKRLRRDLEHANVRVLRVEPGLREAGHDLYAAITLASLLHQAGIVPLRHRAPLRVQGHLTLCLLTAWLLRALNLRLAEAQADLTAAEAVSAAVRAEALVFRTPCGTVCGRPPLSGDLSAALEAAGVEDARAAIDAAVESLPAG
jgi:hypothetical protein